MRHRTSFLTVGLVTTAFACGILDPTFSEPGLIIFYGDTATIVAPDSVDRGTVFEVSVETFAGGCTRTIARTERRVLGSVLELRPVNETRRAQACTDDLLILVHRVTLRFDQPGPVTIRVVAEQRPVNSSSRNGPAQLERVVIVR